MASHAHCAADAERQAAVEGLSGSDVRSWPKAKIVYAVKYGVIRDNIHSQK
jgi:hypothetical protein